MVRWKKSTVKDLFGTNSSDSRHPKVITSFWSFLSQTICIVEQGTTHAMAITWITLCPYGWPANRRLCSSKEIVSGNGEIYGKYRIRLTWTKITEHKESFKEFLLNTEYLSKNAMRKNCLISYCELTNAIYSIVFSMRSGMNIQWHESPTATDKFDCMYTESLPSFNCFFQAKWRNNWHRLLKRGNCLQPALLHKEVNFLDKRWQINLIS